MKVLKIVSKEVAKKLDFTVKDGNRRLEFVPDGNGDLITGLEVLEDPSFAELKDELQTNCEVIDYVTTEGRSVVVRPIETKYDSIIIKK